MIMANLTRLEAQDTRDSVLTTGLNSLASGSATAASSAVDNTTTRYQLCDDEMVLGSINPSGSPYVEIHFLKEIVSDGSTTFEDRTLGTLVGIIPVTTGSSAKNGSVKRVPLPDGDFKVVAVNQTGQTLAASGNSMYLHRFGENLIG